MLLEAIATVILAGMMLIPLANLFVGVIVGASLGGAAGALAGFALAAAVTVAEKLIGDRRGWFDLKCDIKEGAIIVPHMSLQLKFHKEISTRRLRTPSDDQ